MRRPAKILILALLAHFATGTALWAQQRFPPPEFESGYKMPGTTIPAARAAVLPYVDVAVLAGCLGVSLWLVYKKRSRRGVFWLSLFSLAYFGFYRKGCICPIGSPQNVIYGLFHPEYAVPLTVVAFFALPLFTALVAGRAFCAGVCPQGALQDFMLVKPLRVPLWLEHGLSTIPFIFLGAGLAFAATGSGFIICRYDPFVPVFRLSGSFFILTLGGLFLLAGMFIGRPYCRFLCPYGAMLKSAALVSRWRVRVTPTTCTQCRLCEQSCPFGALRTPSDHAGAPVTRTERSRLGRLLALLPALIAAGAVLGALTSPAAARLDPDVSLADLYLRQKQTPVTYSPGTPEALALARVEQKPDAILQAAAVMRGRFKLATVIFGGWVGLVVGCKLIALSVRSSQTDYEPDRGACFACARCFSHCPSELTRRGVAAGAIQTPMAVAEEGP